MVGQGQEGSKPLHRSQKMAARKKKNHMIIKVVDLDK